MPNIYGTGECSGNKNINEGYFKDNYETMEDIVNLGLTINKEKILCYFSTWRKCQNDNPT